MLRSRESSHGGRTITECRQPLPRITHRDCPPSDIWTALSASSRGQCTTRKGPDGSAERCHSASATTWARAASSADWLQQPVARAISSASRQSPSIACARTAPTPSGQYELLGTESPPNRDRNPGTIWSANTSTPSGRAVGGSAPSRQAEITAANAALWTAVKEVPSPPAPEKAMSPPSRPSRLRHSTKISFTEVPEVTGETPIEVAEASGEPKVMWFGPCLPRDRIRCDSRLPIARIFPVPRLVQKRHHVSGTTGWFPDSSGQAHAGREDS